LFEELGDINKFAVLKRRLKRLMKPEVSRQH